MPQVSSAPSIIKHAVTLSSLIKGVPIPLRFDFVVLVPLPGAIRHATHAQVQEIETAVPVRTDIT